jgi:class 3 adenylate cyclase
MQGGRGQGAKMGLAPNQRLKTFLNGEVDSNEDHNQPIADLFPQCTVFFADIAGFTAWSSTREPAQVFLLLQAVYQAFDVLAKKRRVFKVETIGDSYVAVTGLPEPQSDHAMIMVRFASECLIKLGTITKELEVTLGPETGDLSMRVGLHSGPVTAGVLRGDRARFQLFGDTVNTGKTRRIFGRHGAMTITMVTHTFSIIIPYVQLPEWKVPALGIRSKSPKRLPTS